MMCPPAGTALCCCSCRWHGIGRCHRFPKTIHTARRMGAESESDALAKTVRDPEGLWKTLRPGSVNDRYEGRV